MTAIVLDFWKCRGRYCKAGMDRARRASEGIRVGLDEDPAGAEHAGQEEEGEK